MEFPGHSNPPKRHKLLANAALHHPLPPPPPQSTLPTTPLQPTFLMSSLCSPIPQPSHHHTDSNRDCALSLSLPSSDRDYAGRPHKFSDRPVRREIVSSGNEVWRSSVPLGPFTGYASILSRSRFLKPAQDLLDEFCGTKLGFASPNSLQCLDADADDSGSPRNLIHGDVEDSSRSSALTLLLDEVFRRYKQYYQHLQSVVASFETVPGLGNASPYVSFALRTLQYQFSCLKKTIFERTQIAVEPLICGRISNEIPVQQALEPSYENQEQVQGPRQPVWRTQRGLPASAVAVFKKWLFEHFLHPYPSDSEKHLLAKQTGLSRSQVSNWFINARVRLWKPLVEEIHTLDTQQGQPASDPNASQPTILHQAADTLTLLHSAHAAPTQLTMQSDDRLNRSSSRVIHTDCHHLFLTSKSSQRGENFGISLALGPQQDSEKAMQSQPK